MTKEELIAFLKENLRVQISSHWADYDSDASRVEVTIFLGDDVITEDSCTVK